MRSLQRLSALAILPMLVILTIPLLGLISRSSVGAIWQALWSNEVQQALIVTAWTSGWALLLIVLLGTPMAVWLARLPSQHWASLVVDLPGVLPPAVAGLALLSVFGRTGWLGPLFADWGINIPFTPVAVVLAQLFVAAPLYIRSVSIALRGIDEEVLQAGALDGAHQGNLWRYIIVPLAAPGFQTGTAMALARALGEFGATALFAGSLPGYTRTMALAIYINADYDSAQAVAMSLILLGCAILLLSGARLAQHSHQQNDLR